MMSLSSNDNEGLLLRLNCVRKQLTMVHQIHAIRYSCLKAAKIKITEPIVWRGLQVFQRKVHVV